MKGVFMAEADDTARLKLQPSRSSQEEIASFAEEISMRLRERNVFDTLRSLLDQPEKFAEFEVASISLAESEENDRLLSREGKAKGVLYRQTGNDRNFTIFLNPPCSIFQLNKTIALLLSNCLLHVDVEDLPDGEYFLNAGNVDDLVRQQSTVFSEAFLFPRPLVEEYVHSHHMSPAGVASLLGTNLSDYKSAPARELIQALAVPQLLAS